MRFPLRVRADALGGHRGRRVAHATDAEGPARPLRSDAPDDAATGATDANHDQPEDEMAERREPEPPRHESLDHEHPTDAGLMDPAGEEVPGTGVFGDETLVRPAEGVERPGIARRIPPARPAEDDS